MGDERRAARAGARRAAAGRRPRLHRRPQREVARADRGPRRAVGGLLPARRLPAAAGGRRRRARAPGCRSASSRSTPTCWRPPTARRSPPGRSRCAATRSRAGSATSRASTSRSTAARRGSRPSWARTSAAGRGASGGRRVDLAPGRARDPRACLGLVRGDAAGGRGRAVEPEGLRRTTRARGSGSRRAEGSNCGIEGGSGDGRRASRAALRMRRSPPGARLSASNAVRALDPLRLPRERGGDPRRQRRERRELDAAAPALPRPGRAAVDQRDRADDPAARMDVRARARRRRRSRGRASRAGTGRRPGAAAAAARRRRLGRVGAGRAGRRRPRARPRSPRSPGARRRARARTTRRDRPASPGRGRGGSGARARRARRRGPAPRARRGATSRRSARRVARRARALPRPRASAEQVRDALPLGGDARGARAAPRASARGPRPVGERPLDHAQRPRRRRRPSSRQPALASAPRTSAPVSACSQPRSSTATRWSVPRSSHVDDQRRTRSTRSRRRAAGAQREPARRAGPAPGRRAAAARRPPRPPLAPRASSCAAARAPAQLGDPHPATSEPVAQVERVRARGSPRCAPAQAPRLEVGAQRARTSASSSSRRHQREDRDVRPHDRVEVRLRPAPVGHQEAVAAVVRGSARPRTARAPSAASAARSERRRRAPERGR